MTAWRGAVWMLAGLVVAACVGPPRLPPGPSLDEVRAENRARLARLALGMLKEDVLAAMGTETVPTYRYELGPFGRPEAVKGLIVPNPYRTEAVEMSDGSTLEILFYYTDRERSEGKITEDELTPLVLENGTLVGWGWPQLQQTFNRQPTKARIYLWDSPCDVFRNCPRGRH